MSSKNDWITGGNFQAGTPTMQAALLLAFLGWTAAFGRGSLGASECRDGVVVVRSAECVRYCNEFMTTGPTRRRGVEVDARENLNIFTAESRRWSCAARPLVAGDWRIASAERAGFEMCASAAQCSDSSHSMTPACVPCASVCESCDSLEANCTASRLKQPPCVSPHILLLFGLTDDAKAHAPS